MIQGQDNTFNRLAAPYDRGMAPLERIWLRGLREKLVPQAGGRVLEIGIGTGANLPFYGDSVCLTAIDESTEMLDISAQRASALNRCVPLSQADAEHLVFPDNAFDTVVASLVLCSVLSQEQALSEVRRVLCAPGGQLLLLEHMRPYRPGLAILSDLANLPWYAFNGRCHLNRRTQQVIMRAGFVIDHVESRLGGLFRAISATVC